MAEESLGWAVKDPDEGVLVHTARLTRVECITDFAWGDNRRRWTDYSVSQAVEMADITWRDDLQPVGYRVVPVKLVEVEQAKAEEEQGG